MSGHGRALTHESDVIEYSPYLFLSLLVLSWNILSTLVGIGLNAGDPLASGIAVLKIIFYVLSLLGFFIIGGAAYLAKKCAFSSSCLNKFSPSRTGSTLPKQVVLKDLLYNIIFMAMGVLYLAGDNSSIFICSTASTLTVSRAACHDVSSMIVGISLLLHLVLYLVDILKILSTPKPTIPVEGRIRKAYENALQLAKFAILIDQTFTTAVHKITHVDLEDDAIGKCGCHRNTTAEVERCSDTLNIEVGVFFSLLMTILLVIVVLVLMKNFKDYCKCCWNQMDSEDDKLVCCCLCWENFGIFTFYIFVFLFIVTYTLADNRWLWSCAIHDKDASFWMRIVFLLVSLTFTIVMSLVYICIIWHPSVCIVRQRNRQTADHVTTANTDMLCVVVCARCCNKNRFTKCCKCCLFFKCCNCCVSKCWQSCLERLSNPWGLCQKSNYSKQRYSTLRSSETDLHVRYINLDKEDINHILIIRFPDGRKLELTEQVQDETGTKDWAIRKTTGTEQEEAPSPVTESVDIPPAQNRTEYTSQTEGPHDSPQISPVESGTPLAQNSTEDKLQQAEGPQDSPQIIQVERSTYTSDTERNTENTPGTEQVVPT